jgi:preprotein translocase subunit SecA
MIFAADLTAPAPGPLWGLRPQRPDGAARAAARLPWPPRSPHRACAALAAAAAEHARQAAVADASDWADRARDAGVALRRQGFVAAALAPALGLVAAVAARTLGKTPYATQIHAAAALLGGHMAEMATGEGKTLATGLAAATAALAGVPVHVVTANDYLAQRDARLLEPMYAALGLRAALLRPGDGDDAKRATYAADIVYATAKELAFDHLRDLQDCAAGPRHDLEWRAAKLTGAPTAAPRMRGLCMALLDEADSILLDEADIPLILSVAVPHAARRAFLWQALALARQLDADRDFELQRVERRAVLTPQGEQRVGVLGAPLGGPWLRARYRREAVTVALAGLHLLQRDHDYLVRDGRIELIDAVTGRVAPGRVWSRGLHAVIEMKEGLPASDDAQTLARTTFQRFFARYWRLAGTSGTLWEARAELRRVFGKAVVRVPLHRPSQRVEQPLRWFPTQAALFDAAVRRTTELRAQGRPVLLGTDSVADSIELSHRLTAAGIGHRVLNAAQDADEATVVAQAGRSASVTVATRMAGRGTDIELDAAARAAGGLHIIDCQHNPSRRLDRQLAGRAARQGDPGSVQAWRTPQKLQGLPPTVALILAAWNRTRADQSDCWTRPQWLLRFALRGVQWREERRRAVLREALQGLERQWEKRLAIVGPAP